ncbi:17,18-epoxy-17-hydroxycur-19-ene N-malonyltransferase-like [Castanea sativa]|uniref:17,18-epoxy-17-hydroxycur-19-ene N-malonyltransferase-like n=1 Tax=Castanea sativa TaxID=21020 RepID=UPI003F651F8A
MAIGDLTIIPEVAPKVGNSFAKRFVFDASKIAALKAIVGDKVKNPTRVEVVTALIYKCAISASRSSSGSAKPTLLLLPINMRKSTEPPLPENTMGNAASLFAVSTMEGRVIYSCMGVIVMMDTRNGDGIEVFVNLEDEDMAVFERDTELLGYASFNPSALALI